MLPHSDIHTVGLHSRERLLSPQSCPDLERYNIVSAGLTDAGKGFLFVRNHPTISQVLACTGGAGQVYIDGKWRTCSSDMAYVTPPLACHAYRTTPHRRWQFCWVKYHGGEPPVVNSARESLIQVDARPLLEILTCLHRETFSGADPRVLSHLVHVMDIFARRIAGPVMMKDRLRTIWEAVTADISHPWTLSELAGIISVSEEHLRRLCRAQTGYSPMHQVARLRMQRACDLLTSTPLKIQDVAQVVGYDNAFAFTAAFRRAFGVTPSLFRNRFLKQD